MTEREKFLDIEYLNLINKLFSCTEAEKPEVEKKIVEVNIELSDMYTLEAWLNQ